MLVDTAAPFHATSLAAIANHRAHQFSLAKSAVRRSLTARMDAELEKLVDSGKLRGKAAEQLDQLKTGTFCLHKSWCFGRVAEWNLLLNQIVIDFQGKKAHPMQLPYAADNLTVIPSEHFLARKATDLASIKNLAREDPPALVRNIL